MAATNASLLLACLSGGWCYQGFEEPPPEPLNSAGYAAGLPLMARALVDLSGQDHYARLAAVRSHRVARRRAPDCERTVTEEAPHRRRGFGRARGFVGLTVPVAPTRAIPCRSRAEIRAVRRWGACARVPARSKSRARARRDPASCEPARRRRRSRVWLTPDPAHP
jgi:hypothetical protein